MAGRSISDAGQVCHRSKERHCGNGNHAKDDGEIHTGVLFVVIVVGLNCHDVLTFKFVGPACFAAGLCLIFSVGGRPKKPIQPIEKKDRLLFALLD